MNETCWSLLAITYFFVAMLSAWHHHVSGVAVFSIAACIMVAMLSLVAWSRKSREAEKDGGDEVHSEGCLCKKGGAE